MVDDLLADVASLQALKEFYELSIHDLLPHAIGVQATTKAVHRQKWRLRWNLLEI